MYKETISDFRDPADFRKYFFIKWSIVESHTTSSAAPVRQFGFHRETKKRQLARGIF